MKMAWNGAVGSVLGVGWNWLMYSSSKNRRQRRSKENGKFLSFSKELEPMKRWKNNTFTPSAQVRSALLQQFEFSGGWLDKIRLLFYAFIYELLLVQRCSCRCCCSGSQENISLLKQSYRKQQNNVMPNSVCRSEGGGWRNSFSQRLQPCNWYHSAANNKDIEIMVSLLIMIQNNKNTESFVFDLSMCVKLLLL